MSNRPKPNASHVSEGFSAPTFRRRAGYYLVGLMIGLILWAMLSQMKRSALKRTQEQKAVTNQPAPVAK